MLSHSRLIFSSVDFFQNPVLYSFVEKEFREVTRLFVLGDEFTAFCKRAEEKPKEFPADFLKACADIGFLGMDISPEYGGIGLTPLEQAAVIEEFSRGHAGLGLGVLVHNSLASYPINTFGNHEQKSRYLPGMASGELFGCFALTEPNVGSDATALETKAIRDETRRGWKIRGSKQFITSANGADIAVVAARTGTTESRGRGISAFIVEIKDKTEVTIPEPYTKIGQKGSTLCEIHFDDLFVPDENLLGQLNGGWKPVFGSTLNHSRVQIASQAVGIAQRALDETKSYGEGRKQYGKFLTELPGWANHLSLLKRQVELSRFLTQKAAAHETENDPDFFVWASVAKLIAAESVIRIAADAMLLHGGMGYMADMPIALLLADAAPIRIYEGSSHVQCAILEKYFSRKRLAKLFLPGDSVIRNVSDMKPLDELKEEIDHWKFKKPSPYFKVIKAGSCLGSSVVERHLGKMEVAGSIPASGSRTE